MHRFSAVALAIVLLLSLAPARAHAQEDGPVREDELGIPRASVSELRKLRRMLLVVNRMLSIDTSGPVHDVFREIFEDSTRTTPRHEYAYGLVSRRLEKYAAENQSLVSVERAEEAEFIIVFKVVKLVNSFSKDEPFVYGEMFVFLNRTAERPTPALVWRTKGDHTTPEDAVKEFVRQLKAVRGER